MNVKCSHDKSEWWDLRKKKKKSQNCEIKGENWDKNPIYEIKMCHNFSSIYFLQLEKGLHMFALSLNH